MSVLVTRAGVLWQRLYLLIFESEGYDDKFCATLQVVYAFEGDSASPEAIEAMKYYGLDISKHCSKTLDYEMIKDAYIILTMTRDHKE